MDLRANTAKEKAEEMLHKRKKKVMKISEILNSIEEVESKMKRVDEQLMEYKEYQKFFDEISLVYKGRNKNANIDSSTPINIKKCSTNERGSSIESGGRNDFYNGKSGKLDYESSEGQDSFSGLK
jgi:hypothetical protein